MERTHSFRAKGAFAAAVLLLCLVEAATIDHTRTFSGVVKESFDDDQVAARRHDVSFSWCRSSRENSDGLDIAHIHLLYACLCSDQSFQDTHIMLRLATSSNQYSVWFSQQTDKQQVLFAGQAASREECVLAAVPLLSLRGREVLASDVTPSVFNV